MRRKVQRLRWESLRALPPDRNLGTTRTGWNSGGSKVSTTSCRQVERCRGAGHSEIVNCHPRAPPLAPRAS